MRSYLVVSLLALALTGAACSRRLTAPPSNTSLLDGSRKLLPSMVPDVYYSRSRSCRENPVYDDIFKATIAEGQITFLVKPETPRSALDYLFSKYDIKLCDLIEDWETYHVWTPQSIHVVMDQLRKEPLIVSVRPNIGMPFDSL